MRESSMPLAKSLGLPSSMMAQPPAIQLQWALPLAQAHLPSTV